MKPAYRADPKLKAIREKYLRARPQPCMRCGQPIDYDAHRKSPNSFHLGHKLSWADHPELRTDPGNLQQEHAGCNLSAGKTNEVDTFQIGISSRKW
ncbi:hypothetical protein [Actinomyces sp.]|jgi:hypothetical protein|uniref:hypothetical protein n=1 Tax=Actinomyces sp. TaxID=29317 RepID=UPI002618A4ED|nr:hypothetical protein [Actinomyces sp.]MDU6757684.1 hypothetical protein [Actinomyces sp.]